MNRSRQRIRSNFYNIFLLVLVINVQLILLKQQRRNQDDVTVLSFFYVDGFLPSSAATSAQKQHSKHHQYSVQYREKQRQQQQQKQHSGFGVAISASSRQWIFLPAGRTAIAVSVTNQVFDSSGSSSGSEEEGKEELVSNSVEVTVYRPKEILETLSSYLKTVQQSRRGQKGATKSANSLARYLSENPILVMDWDIDYDDDESSTGLLHRFQEVLERVMIQALRKAGESNDYKLILKLVSSSIVFANHHPILSPRIFGEAISAMSATDANIAKLKSIWNLMALISESAEKNEISSIPPERRRRQHQQQKQQQQRIPSFLKSSPTAYELNILLKAMASRGKTRGCVDIVIQHVDNKKETTAPATSIPIYIEPDAYTISTLFSILMDSISADQKLCDPIDFSLCGEIPSNDDPSSTRLYHELISLTSSPCWQWNSAIEVLSAIHNNNNGNNVHRFREKVNNNYVYSSLLKLQVKAQKSFPDDHQNGHRLTMAILDDMIRNDILPDVVTCTVAMEAMDQVRLETLCSEGKMTNLAVDFLQRMKSNPRLPNPNQYSYSTAIMACAKQNDHETALDLLEEMRESLVKNHSSDDSTSVHSSLVVPPNKWVYNAVLLALDDHSGHEITARSRKNRTGDKENAMDVALSILDQMKSDHDKFGLDTEPDTVTYNTILNIAEFSNNAVTPSMIIDEMKKERIPRDDITYHNAIAASTDSKEVISILHEFLDDSHSIPKLVKRPRSNVLVTVFNSALNILAEKSDFVTLKDALILMVQHKIVLNDQSLSALISAVGKSQHTPMLKILTSNLHEAKSFGCLDWQARTNAEVESATLMDNEDVSSFVLFLVTALAFPSVNRDHYIQAIELCLEQSDFATARELLSQMRSHAIMPTTQCMETFAASYASSAMISTPGRMDVNSTSYARAESAFKIVTSLSSPNPTVLGTVARACAVTGQWNNTRTLLRTIHHGFLSARLDGQLLSNKDLDNVRRTHSFLLHACSKDGNIRFALLLTKDIQRFSKKLYVSKHSEKDETPSSGLAEIPLNEDDMFAGLRDLAESTAVKTRVGMHPRDWISLIKTASKSGDWRICFNALQFLRIYVVRTRSRKDASSTDHRYEQLMPGLTAAVRCLESHSQHAWAERCIFDWIEWSGRKPRAEAVLSAIRSLSAKGHGDEVKRLVDECVRENLGCCVTKKGVGYEEMLFIGAITSLHNNGLYDDADEVFMSAISAGYLPFDFVEEAGESVLDLHGLNVALAHSAVRVAMRQHAARFVEAVETPDMIIVTGKGRKSAFHLRPVLRPEAQRMLLEEFYPPLNSLSVPQNIGALRVFGRDIRAWQQHQQEQKGARMLELADLLRNLSCQERLKRTIEISIKAIQKENRGNRTCK